MEQGHRAIAGALVGSGAALRELSAMAKEVLAGELGAHELLARASAMPPDALRGTLDAMQRAPARGAVRRARRAEEYFELLVRHHLSEGALDRIARRLETASGKGLARAPVSARQTAATIARSRAALAASRAAFVEANVGLVVSMATRKAQLGLPLHDLIQEGCMGVMRAAEKFDYRRGVRFSTYAGWWIRHTLNRALSDQGRTIRIPVHLVDKQYQLRQHERELGLELGREPTEAELAARAGLPIDKVELARTVPRRSLSLDAPVAADADATFGDFIADSRSPSALEAASNSRLGERLRELLHTLSPRERDVIRLRFGIDTKSTLTLKEIGDRLAMSRERIRQIEAEALAKLRAHAATQELESMLG
jgi:RNA polymerase primary sigma factor